VSTFRLIFFLVFITYWLMPLSLCALYGASSKAKTWDRRTTLKCLRSSVAMMVAPTRSATAMTEASTVPRPRSSYISTSSGDPFDVDVTDVLHPEATRHGAAEEVALDPRLGATRG